MTTHENALNRGHPTPTTAPMAELHDCRAHVVTARESAHAAAELAGARNSPQRRAGRQDRRRHRQLRADQLHRDRRPARRAGDMNDNDETVAGPTASDAACTDSALAWSAVQPEPEIVADCLGSALWSEFAVRSACH